MDDKESKEEQIQNLVDNYKETQSYMEDYYEKIPKSNLKNIQEKQDNRKKQIEDLARNIYKSNHEE